MAKMRLQFWRETLDDIFKDKPPKQPVAMALLKVGAIHISLVYCIFISGISSESFL